MYLFELHSLKAVSLYMYGVNGTVTVHSLAPLYKIHELVNTSISDSFP